MDITVSGWSRDCGTIEIASADVLDARAEPGHFTFKKKEAVLALNEGRLHPVKSVTLYCFTKLRLGGDYKLRMTLHKQEIARLFYLTHRREIERFSGIFVPPAEDPGESDA